MEISTQDIQSLRESMGVGIMDAKKALQDAGGDMEQATRALKATGAKFAEKRAGRITNEGWIGEYVHSNGKEAGLVALACETDFVSRTDDFRTLAHDIALHVVATRPAYVTSEEVPTDILEAEEKIWKEQLAKEGKPEKIMENILKGKREKYFKDVCLMKQLYVKDDSRTVEEVINSAVAKLGENIKVTGFTLLSL